MSNETMDAVAANTEIQFSPEQLQEIAQIRTHFPEGKHKSAILRILHMAQETFGGWLSVPVMDYIAGLLNIKPIEVYEVASFYSMYNLRPVGKVMLEVCQTGPCCLVGAERIISYLENKLDIKVGETSADGMFTLKTVECLGACGYAPMMQVGMHYYEHLDEARVDALLEEFRRKAESGENMHIKMKG
jgi:NADH-quinone oxidoreductase subunit E